MRARLVGDADGSSRHCSGCSVKAGPGVTSLEHAVWRKSTQKACKVKPTPSGEARLLPIRDHVKIAGEEGVVRVTEYVPRVSFVGVGVVVV